MGGDTIARTAAAACRCAMSGTRVSQITTKIPQKKIEDLASSFCWHVCQDQVTIAVMTAVRLVPCCLVVSSKRQQRSAQLLSWIHFTNNSNEGKLCTASIRSGDDQGFAKYSSIPITGFWLHQTFPSTFSHCMMMCIFSSGLGWKQRRMVSNLRRHNDISDRQSFEDKWTRKASANHNPHEGKEYLRRRIPWLQCKSAACMKVLTKLMRLWQWRWSRLLLLWSGRPCNPTRLFLCHANC